MVTLRVIRKKGHDGDAKEEVTLPWDDSFRFDREIAINAYSPIAIRGLGIAYQVDTTVEDVVRFPFTRVDPLRPPEEYARLRETSPVCKVTLWDGSWAWLLTRYEDVRAVLYDKTSSADTLNPNLPHPPRRRRRPSGGSGSSAGWIRRSTTSTAGCWPPT